MVEKLLIREINKLDEKLLTEFIDNAGSSIKTFRYFDKRPIEVLDNHKLTLLGLVNDKPVGYGHLDYEGGRVWLGVALVESCKGKGYGKQIMNYLLSYGDQNDFSEIYLAVDKVNKVAVGMYNKFNFHIVKELNKDVILMKRTKE